jgi:A/G-specific adenine glycosylase
VSAAFDPAEVAARIEAWYGRGRRDLPWRRRRDPYAVWVAEVMLQQTRASTVAGRYEAFLARFPDVGRLAAAPADEVLAAWEGLGYYRRALALHAAARIVAHELGGRLPDDPALLAKLPGFGPYMAAAVASIAFGRREAATDANAQRVFARLLRLAAPRSSAALARAAAAAHAQVMAAARDPGALNQALMDLGSGLCGRRPRCPACPLLPCCAAGTLGPAVAAAYPRPRPSRPRPAVRVATAAVAAPGGRILALRRPPGLLGHMWGLPSGEAAAGRPDAAGEALADLVRALEGDLGLPPGSGAGLRRVGGLGWTFTHRTWEVDVYRLEVAAAWAVVGARWLDPAELARAAFGGPFRRALALAGCQPP